MLKSEVHTQNASSCVQAERADAALGLAQAQHLRQLQQLQERAGDGCREQVELLQARLVEEQRRSQQLEETLRLQAQQSSSQISMKQVQHTLFSNKVKFCSHTSAPMWLKCSLDTRKLNCR